MNAKNLYVPNHEKWLRYYENVSSHRHLLPTTGVVNKTEKGEETGINTQSSQSIIPIELEKKVHSNKEKVASPEVKLVSPSQQTVEKAESVLKRTNMRRIKKRQPSKRKFSYKKTFKKAGRKGSGSKVKRQSKKKSRKRQSKDIFV